MAKKLLGIRFHDGKINPESFSAKELGQILIDLEETLKSIAKAGLAGRGNEDDIKISLIDIQKKSNGLVLKNIGPPIGLRSFNFLANKIKDEDLTGLPERAILFTKNIKRTINAKHCKAEFSISKQVICDLSPETKLVESKREYYNEDILVYGFLVQISGDNPHLKLKTANQDIHFNVPIDTAKSLRNYLYETVGIKGQACYDLKTNNIVGFKYYDVTPYTAGRISEGFKKLKEESSGVWDELVKTNKDINNFLRKD